MKNLLIAVALCGGVLSTWAASPVIKAVTVYPQGAMITEEGSLKLTGGVNKLEWGTLSQAIDADGIRVDLPTGAKARIIDRTVEAVETTVDTSARREALQSQLEKAKDARQAVLDSLALVRKNQEFLDQIQKASTTPTKGELPTTFPTIPQWKDLSGFLSSGWDASLKEQRKIEAAELLAREEVNRIEREIANLGVGDSRTQLKLVLTVEATTDVTVPVSVSYFDPSATWAPTYQVWVDSAKNKVEVVYGAQLRQWTSQDWKDVAVTLSTARPRGGMTPPTPGAWWVRERQVMMYKAAMMSNARVSSMEMASGAAMQDSASDAMAPAPRFAPVEISEKLTHAEYVLPWKVTVKNDNTESKTTIATVPLTAELRYKILPEFSTEAYLTGKVVNTSSFTFLPGGSQLFVDGAFIGRAGLNLVQPNESFDLALGVDAALKVESKLLEKKTDLTGFGDENKKITYRYETTLENLKNASIMVELVDRLPLSQHEKIKVEVLEPKALAKEVDKEGMLTWKLPLKAHEKTKLNLAYSIEFPKKMEIDGLK